MNLKLYKPDIFKENTAEDYLRYALETSNWIESFQVPAEDGKYWHRSPEAEDDEFIHVPFFGERCLYCGAAGLGLYYLRVYDVTGDKKYLDEAVAAADYLIATDEGTSFYEKTRNSEIGGVLKVPGWALGIYNGPTGEGLFYDRLYERVPDEKYVTMIRKIADDLLEVAYQEPAGLRWSDQSDLVADGGFVMYLILAYKRTKEERYLEAAKKAADYIAEGTIELDNGGVRWQLMDLRLLGFGEGDFFPNFAHGTAGIAWMFATLYKESKVERYLELAKRAVVYLQSIAVGDESGTLIPYLDNPKTGPTWDKYYLSTCHGPVGTTLVFRMLYELTGEQGYLDWIKRLARGIIRAGAPEKNSWGYWASNCQCCGAPGVLEHFVSVYELTGEEEFLEYAKRTADVLVGDSQLLDGKRRWMSAWNRPTPEVVKSFTGFYVGSAGGSSSLLKLYSALENKPFTDIFEYIYFD